MAGEVDEARLLRVAGIAGDSIVDGPGIRLTVFTQGCPHACPGCHNPETHPIGEGGYLCTVDEIWERARENPLLDGVTFSGGEPLLQPLPLIELADRCHEAGLNVWCYTGYLYEDVLEGAAGDDARRLVACCDVLVDGPYEQDKRSLGLRFRGSSNQRIIELG